MSSFRCAAARRIVTPNPLLPVTAGAAPARPAHEKLGELEVRVLVFESGATRVGIASMPFLGFSERLCDWICLKVDGIPSENILIGATHCHSAPDTYGFPNEEGGYDIDFEYLYGVCDATADAFNEAVNKLEPAHLKIATGEAQGKIAYNYYAPDLYDPRCHVIQAIRPGGEAIATLVNYAIHPEILLHQEVCSPDLVGPLYDHIEAHGGGLGLFMNSAQGGMITADIRTPEGDKEEWSECERVGTLLAEEALRIIADAAPQVDPVLSCHAQQLTFPVNEIIGQMLTMLHPESRMQNVAPDDVPVHLMELPVQEILGQAHTYLDQPPAPLEGPIREVAALQNLVNIGTAQILTIPGEALPNIGYYLKRKMRGKDNLLFGLTNDAFGYILTKVDYDSFQKYEYITQTCMHEEMGEILIQKSLELIENSPEPGA